MSLSMPWRGALRGGRGVACPEGVLLPWRHDALGYRLYERPDASRRVAPRVSAGGTDIEVIFLAFLQPDLPGFAIYDDRFAHAALRDLLLLAPCSLITSLQFPDFGRCQRPVGYVVQKGRAFVTVLCYT